VPRKWLPLVCLYLFCEPVKRSDQLTDCSTLSPQLAGYCYGGKVGFYLAFDHKVKALAVHHPSLLDVPSDLEKLKASAVPTLFNVNEHDSQFDPTKQAIADRLFEGQSGTYRKEYFPGMNHGFAVRGDMSKSAEKESKEKAFENVVGFFKEKL